MNDNTIIYILSGRYKYNTVDPVNIWHIQDGAFHTLCGRSLTSVWRSTTTLDDDPENRLCADCEKHSKQVV